MILTVSKIVSVIGVFFLIYLVIYATYLLVSVLLGAFNLYKKDRMRKVNNELKHDFYYPVSVLVPAYNEEVTIVDSVHSLLNLKYRLYEIIVIDDGSKDDTSKCMIEHFQMKKINRPIRRVVQCKAEKAIYETSVGGIKVTLITKENGGKGDALNMGINAARFPYFVSLDADSMLQQDSLEKIMQVVLEDDSVVAVGGLIRISQCVKMENGEVTGYHLPWNMLLCMQVMEYDRSFLASRILLDSFNGNMIISGAFGLFKRDVAVAVGGYDVGTLGEDMELVMKLHLYCKNNKMDYSIRYEPNAICWSQAPGRLGDLRRQRRRWHLGLFQSLVKYRQIFMKSDYGLLGAVSYLYYLLYELLSPFIEILGLIITVVAGAIGLLNVQFMIRFFLFYAVYSAILTLTAFFQRIYSQNLKISLGDIIKACIMCLVENVFFRFFFDFARMTAFIGYKKNKRQWGKMTRTKHFINV